MFCYVGAEVFNSCKTCMTSALHKIKIGAILCCSCYKLIIIKGENCVTMTTEGKKNLVLLKAVRGTFALGDNRGANNVLLGRNVL